LTYEDIVAFATDNVPRTFGEYGDMIRWLDTSIPNWRLMEEDKQEEIKDVFRERTTEVREPTPQTIARDLDQIERDLEQIPEISFPQPEQKGFVSKVISKIRNFLGRIF
jgi:hypothetical protein